MKLRILLALILCNSIWASNPTMAKLLMRDFSPLQTGWLRYSSALLGLIVFLLGQRFFAPHAKPHTKTDQAKQLPYTTQVYSWLVLLGLVTFFGSPVFAFLGLGRSTATANSLLVALEPIFCMLLAWVILRERIGKKQWAAVFISLVGFVLLSHIGFQQFNNDNKKQLFGNFLLLLSIPCEAMYTIGSRILRHKVSPVEILTFSLPVGFLFFTIFVMFTPEGLPNVLHFSLTNIVAILWLGPLASTFGYIYWSTALNDAPVAPVVLTLLVQPVVGSLNGFFWLGEHLALTQFLGGALIFAALLFETDFKKTAPKETA